MLPSAIFAFLSLLRVFSSDVSALLLGSVCKHIPETCLHLLNPACPADFEYSIQLPPEANEQPTESYLTALASMYFYVTTIALGTTASRAEEPTCALGWVHDLMRKHVMPISVHASPKEDRKGNAFLIANFLVIS